MWTDNLVVHTHDYTILGGCEKLFEILLFSLIVLLILTSHLALLVINPLFPIVSACNTNKKIQSDLFLKMKKLLKISHIFKNS